MLALDIHFFEFSDCSVWQVKAIILHYGELVHKERIVCFFGHFEL